MTFAGCVLPVGGGTSGGSVRIALMGGPTGIPRSPFAEPPVSSEAARAELRRGGRGRLWRSGPAPL